MKKVNTNTYIEIANVSSNHVVIEGQAVRRIKFNFWWCKRGFHRQHVLSVYEKKKKNYSQQLSYYEIIIWISLLDSTIMKSIIGNHYEQRTHFINYMYMHWWTAIALVCHYDSMSSELLQAVLLT